MPDNRNAFKLGLTLLIFIAIFVGVLMFLAPRGGGDLVLRVRFPHNQFTTTLKIGSEIACGGQPVGSVKALDLLEMPDPQTGYKNLYSLVTVRVESSLALRDNCKFVPEGPILGGPGRLLIMDRGTGRPVQPNQLIEGELAQDFGGLTRMLSAQLDPNDPTSLMAVIKAQLDASDPKSLLGKIHISLEDINAVTQSIRNETDPRQKEVLLAKLHAILDNVNDATRLLKGEVDSTQDAGTLARVHRALDAFNTGMSTAVAMLNENRQPIAETVIHVRNTSQILELQIANRIARQLDTSEAAGLLAKVHVAVDRLGTSLKDVNTITASTRELVTMNKDQINGMIANFKETSDHLKAASKEIRRSPWRLFYQPTIAESAEANVHDAARAFSDAATKLDDAIIRLQAMSQNGGAPIEPKQLKDLSEQLNHTYEDFSKAESALWDQLKIK